MAKVARFRLDAKRSQLLASAAPLSIHPRSFRNASVSSLLTLYYSRTREKYRPVHQVPSLLATTWFEFKPNGKVSNLAKLTPTLLCLAGR